MILSCNNIGKSFGMDQILSNISFHINEYEKVGIVGINGAGKSTLLKIIIGQLQSDEGNVILGKGASIGYLAQHQELSSEHSIYEEVLSVKQDIIDLDHKIRSLEKEMEGKEGVVLEQLLKQYSNYTHQFETANGYAYKSEVIGILKGLGFDEKDFSKKTSSLSGGQKTRIALGKLLLSQHDIILLDEPTNHLDLASISWLETYLLNYKGAVVIVAHDRYFLDKIVTKIIELERSKAQVFQGNYSDYAQKKAALRNALLHQYENQQKEIKHQEEVIAKLRSFNREKSIKRAESREKMLQKIEIMEKPIEKEASMNIRLEPRIISGNDVLTVEDLSKSFGEHTLFEHLDFSVRRGERIAIIGDNGTGKTTILKIINDLIPADFGTIRLGSKVHIGYYDQEHQVLHPDKTLFDELQDTYPTLNNTAIRNTLAAFLFTGDDVFKRIKELSGGERGRVSLAKLMLSEANFLILDEPTNHLDIASKEILEQALNQYTGTILYVSHDRYFINKTATRILDLTHKKLLNYIGNYDYYLEKKDEVEAASHMMQTTDTKTGHTSTHSNKTDILTVPSSSGKIDWKQQKEEQAKLRKKQNDLKKCENEITQLEQRNEEIDMLLSKEDIYTDVSKLINLNNEKKALEDRLTELMEQWELLAE